jgi:hypothetical protein
LIPICFKIATDVIKGFEYLVGEQITFAALIFGLFSQILGQSFNAMDRSIVMTEDHPRTIAVGYPQNSQTILRKRTSASPNRSRPVRPKIIPTPEQRLDAHFVIGCHPSCRFSISWISFHKRPLRRS